jgi:hypothetical protein
MEKLGRREDWDVLFAKDSGLIVCPFVAPRWDTLTVGDAGIYLSWIVQRWLDMVMVVPYLDWTEPKPTIKLRGQELPGALAIELLLIAARTEGWAMCAACQEFYEPKHRRPRAGQRTFCQKCGRQAANRYAQRDRQMRKKLEKARLAKV